MSRSELIKKSSQNFIEKSHKLLGVFSDSDLEFARKCKEFLPAHECAVVHLRFWENLNFSEIAQIIKISEKLVKQIFENAINRLKLIYQNSEIENNNNQPPKYIKSFSKLPSKHKNKVQKINNLALFNLNSKLNTNFKFG